MELTPDEVSFIKVKGEENKAKVLGCALRIRSVLTRAVITERRQEGEAILQGFMTEVSAASLTKMVDPFMEEAFESACDVESCGEDISAEQVDLIIEEVEWLCVRLAAISTEVEDVRRGFGLTLPTG